ncbi:hypothetical protein BC826DRAFT_968514 [Russula brevipes]|nr:hypothetical protein BC826DRAFT_968514 [Russula brevipes]
MPLAVPGSLFASLDKVPSGTFHTLHRRSSCSSIPREDLRIRADCGEVEIYMSPLFGGRGEFGVAHGQVTKRVSAAPIDDFTPRAQATEYDDGISESLSDYQFDITGHEDGPELHQTSEDNPPMAQSSTLTHLNSLLAMTKPPNPEVSQPLPRPRQLSSNREHSPLPVPPIATKPTIPSNTGTRPLQINRSKKHQEPSVTPQRPQRAPRIDVQPGPLSTRPIQRATTHANLRETYRDANALAERKQVPVATLFPTGLIPLERAADKFKHAHCLERLPPQPDLADSSTSSSGNHSRHSRGWSFSRFKKQKA